MLFLAHIYPSTLLQLSIYALVRADSAVVFGAPIGRVVDGFDRLGLVRGSISALIAQSVRQAKTWTLGN